jgi:hypothetical protein
MNTREITGYIMVDGIKVQKYLMNIDGTRTSQRNVAIHIRDNHLCGDGREVQVVLPYKKGMALANSLCEGMTVRVRGKVTFRPTMTPEGIQANAMLYCESLDVLNY